MIQIRGSYRRLGEISGILIIKSRTRCTLYNPPSHIFKLFNIRQSYVVIIYFLSQKSMNFFLVPSLGGYHFFFFFPFPFPLLVPSQRNPRKYMRSWKKNFELFRVKLIMSLYEIVIQADPIGTCSNFYTLNKVCSI